MTVIMMMMMADKDDVDEGGGILCDSDRNEDGDDNDTK